VQLDVLFLNPDCLSVTHTHTEASSGQREVITVTFKEAEKRIREGNFSRALNVMLNLHRNNLIRHKRTICLEIEE